MSSIQKNTMYSPDEVIDNLQETVGIQGKIISSTLTTATREYDCYWEMGHGKAHKTGYVKWIEVERLDENGDLIQADRTVIEFEEN